MIISFTFNGQQVVAGLLAGLAVASADDPTRCATYSALAFLCCFTIKKKAKP